MRRQVEQEGVLPPILVVVPWESLEKDENRDTKRLASAPHWGHPRGVSAALKERSRSNFKPQFGQQYS